MKKIIKTVLISAILSLLSSIVLAQFPVDIGSADGISGITTDASGDVFVTGYSFAAGYNSSGSPLWYLTIDGAGNGVTTDADGNVYVTGNSFVAKYNSSGDYQWGFNIGDNPDNTGYGIATDADGNVYVTGGFWGTTDFDPSAGTAELTSSGLTDIFVAKYNSDGDYQWAFKVGGTFFDIGAGIAVDADGNILLTGEFRGMVDFDPSGITANVTSKGFNDAFVAKYDSYGAYQWGIDIGAMGSFGYGLGITADASDNVFVTGIFTGATNFNPSGGSILTLVGVQDIFVTKYNSSGVYQRAFNMGSTDNICYGYGIAVDNSTGNVYAAGIFSGTVDFDPSVGTAELTASGDQDIFVAEYDSSVFDKCSTIAGNDTAVCSGSSVILGADSISGYTYSWTPATGLSSSIISDPVASPITTTTYTLTEIVDATGCVVSESVIITVNPGNHAGSDKTICSGLSTTIGANNIAGYTYSWIPIVGLSNSSVSNPTASPAVTTTYTLTVTDTNLCKSEASVKVFVHPFDLCTPCGMQTSLGGH